MQIVNTVSDFNYDSCIIPGYNTNNLPSGKIINEFFEHNFNYNTNSNPNSSVADKVTSNNEIINKLSS
jgi:hypothetical protein